ncbi:hypothetical protein CPB85DRAFT_1302840 [Mucidula mucida]|nr:hypothetical protein CPB85DRAFT_1302840 [Mucidula mucida]
MTTLYNATRCTLFSFCLPGSRRYAVLLSASTIRVLQETYAKDRHPDTKKLERLAQELGEDRSNLYQWFFRQRAKKEPPKYSGVQDKCRTRLEAAFRDCLYPNTESKKALSEELMMPMPKLERWFINRRNVEKKYRRQAGLEIQGLVFNIQPPKVQVLEKHFGQNMYPSQSECLALSSSLSLDVVTVKNWFAARRMIERRRRAEAGLEIDLIAYPHPPLPASKPRNKRSVSSSEII